MDDMARCQVPDNDTNDLFVKKTEGRKGPVLEVISNREMAIGVWVLAVLILSFLSRSIRSAFGDVIKVFVAPRVAVVFGLAIVYVLVVIAGLWRAGLWDTSMIKDSVLWLFIGASSSVMTAAISHTATDAFKSTLIQLIKLTIFIEFMVGFYTFPLAVELLLVPFASFLLIVQTVPSIRSGAPMVAAIVDRVIMISGVGLIIWITVRILIDWQQMWSLDTVKMIMLVPLLSVLFVPYLYWVALYSGYDLLFRRSSNFGTNPTEVRWYVRRHLLFHANVRLGRITHLLSEHPHDLMRIRDRNDVDVLFGQSRCH